MKTDHFNFSPKLTFEYQNVFLFSFGLHNNFYGPATRIAFSPRIAKAGTTSC